MQSFLLIGIHEIHINNLKAPPPEYSCRGTKDGWTLILRDRLLRSLSLQTIVPVLVDPSEVTSEYLFKFISSNDISFLSSKAATA